MATNIGFYLSGVIAVGIVFIGCRFLLAPSSAATAYGVPAGAELRSRAYLSAKGIRDIASGLFVAMLIAFGSARALGWFMLIATIIIPLSDAVIVLHQGGSRTVAFGVHGGTANALLIISGLLLID
jgi:cellobiose-specific phosphotransferase system component IIC